MLTLQPQRGLMRGAVCLIVGSQTEHHKLVRRICAARRCLMRRRVYQAYKRNITASEAFTSTAAVDATLRAPALYLATEHNREVHAKTGSRKNPLPQ